MLKKSWGAALAGLALLSSQGAVAEDAGRPITGPQLVEIFQDLGYRAELDLDGAGDPMIITRMGGLNVYVYTYDCNDGACGSLQLSAGLDLPEGSSLEVVQQFNSGHRYARAYLDEENDPFLRYDFEILHTDHAAHIGSQVGIWEELLHEFTVVTGFRSH